MLTLCTYRYKHPFDNLQPNQGLIDQKIYRKSTYLYNVFLCLTRMIHWVRQKGLRFLKVPEQFLLCLLMTSPKYWPEKTARSLKTSLRWSEGSFECSHSLLKRKSTNRLIIVDIYDCVLCISTSWIAKIVAVILVSIITHIIYENENW